MQPRCPRQRRAGEARHLAVEAVEGEHPPPGGKIAVASSDIDARGHKLNRWSLYASLPRRRLTAPVPNESEQGSMGKEV